jgi:hypothetical protein
MTKCGVIQVCGGKLDWAYIEDWAAQLTVTVTLQELRQRPR